MPARIIAIADAYDAMTSDRPYRKALSVEAAIDEIQSNVGTQFDPDIATVFLENIKHWNYILEARVNYLF
jgi:HD-GYP domain-containing protein (c-di-GMP phosphodiesterase class II)